jgi:hypothetical protein
MELVLKNLITKNIKIYLKEISKYLKKSGTLLGYLTDIKGIR